MRISQLAGDEDRITPRYQS